MKSKRDLIVKGNLLKAILLISFPLMLNNFVISSYNVIDAIFVSHIGQMELAVVAFVGPLDQMIAAISVGLAIAGTTLVGYCVGGEDYEKAKITTSHLFIVSMLLGVSIAVTMFFFSSNIMKMASATPDILAKGDRYFKVLVLSIPLIFFNSFYISVKRGYGETLHIMNTQLVSMFVKIVLSYYLVIMSGKGIEALAAATFGGNLVMSIYAYYDLHIKSKRTIIDIGKSELNSKIFVSIFVLGIPIMLEKASASFSFIVINEQVLNYGESVLAAYGITNRINSLFFRTMAGLGSGLATIIVQNLGAKKLDRVKSSIKITMMLGIVFSIIFLAIIFIIAPMFANLLAGFGTKLYGHIMDAVYVYSASLIPWAIMQVGIGVFIGFSNTKYNLLLTVARIYAFRLPCIIILTKFAQLNEFSIWYGMLISNVLTGIFTIILLKATSKSRYDIPDA